MRWRGEEKGNVERGCEGGEGNDRVKERREGEQDIRSREKKRKVTAEGKI